MKKQVGIWLSQVRANFLLLAVALVLIGGGLAHDAGSFSWLPFVLCMLGVILVHVSVNLFNELSDYRTGIDFKTRRTPFSGGTGNMPAGNTTESGVRAAAWGTLITAAVIGLYLASQAGGWLLVAFILIGGLVTLFYTTVLAKIALGEIFAGLCLGSMVVIGTYLAITDEVTTRVILVSVPPGILTSLLLFLNEFPDLEADKGGGRRHLLILLGRKAAGRVYTLFLVVCYGFIAWGILTGWFPTLTFLAFLTLPLAVKAASAALWHFDDFDRMVPALGANVGVVLGVDFLMALGIFL